MTNTDVPYELGFWLREADYQLGNPLHKLTKVSISGGGLYRGQTKDYTVELKPGEYLYSSPLNPTPITSWSSTDDLPSFAEDAELAERFEGYRGYPG